MYIICTYNIHIIHICTIVHNSCLVQSGNKFGCFFGCLIILTPTLPRGCASPAPRFTDKTTCGGCVERTLFNWCLGRGDDFVGSCGGSQLTLDPFGAEGFWTWSVACQMGVSENVVYPKTQWFCWSLSLLNGYFIGNINPTFSDKPKWQQFSVRSKSYISWDPWRHVCFWGIELRAATRALVIPHLPKVPFHQCHTPYTFLFCLPGVYFLGAIYMALHSLASFEMPQVVARYTELLDVPAVTWKLQLGKSGDGKSLVMNFIKEVLKLRRIQLQLTLPRWNRFKRWWRQAVALCAIKKWLRRFEWRHAFVVRECKIFRRVPQAALRGPFLQQRLASFGAVMTTATICRTTTPEFTLEKPLLVTYMAGPLDDKHRCFYHGQELQPHACSRRRLSS